MWLVGLLGGCITDYRELNREACETFLETSRCGDQDFGELLDCAVYETDDYISCDVRPYFRCLSQQTLCVDGALDVSGWPECADAVECD